jgi:hypothetical protein
LELQKLFDLLDQNNIKSTIKNPQPWDLPLNKKLDRKSRADEYEEYLKIDVAKVSSFFDDATARLTNLISSLSHRLR